MASNIIVEIADYIMLIEISRPEKKNALTRAMYKTIYQALLSAEQDKKIRVVLLTGNSECFTAGNDLGDFLDTSQKEMDQLMVPFLNTLAFFKKPIVAAVNGPAVGIGTTILLHCDLVFAGENALFQLPFVNLGLIPEAGSTLLLPQLIGHQRAAELLLLGESFAAKKALQLGIINKICIDDVTLTAATAAAHRIAAQPFKAVCMTKSLLKQDYLEQLRSRITEEAGYFLSCLKSQQTQEALQAFMEKRKPDFSTFE